MGAGTQLLESQLSKMFPTMRVLRMDADTTGGKLSHEQILTKFRNKEADVLVGTQMVAKGHDFPSVSLVGVINADSSLFLDDYRANERTFSLLTQVIGRAGRADIPGRAMIQTYNPENETIKLSAKQDYDKFYEGEIQLRKAAVFPPFCTLLTIKFVCDTEKDARNMAQSFGEELDRLCKGDYNDVKIALYGPFEDTIFKMAGKFRMKYVVKCRNSKRTRQLFSLICASVGTKHKNTGSISVDINPTTV
jgi:primosomal protein N' (replication factor Y)